MLELSVIIPVYNTKDYIIQCVESVLNQKVEEIEIILVDDESPDGAGIICDQLAEKYKTISVIHKKNEGLGFARNTGLNHARGRYVTFLDSDDYVSDNYYEKLIRKADETAADICFALGYFQFNGAKTQKIEIEYLRGVVFSTNTECIRQISRLISRDPDVDDGILSSSCFGIYNREFLERNNLHFVSERDYISEDLWFNMDCFFHASSVCYCDIIGYNYRYNDLSLTRGYRENRFSQLVFFTNELVKKCEKYSLDNYLNRIYVYYWINYEKCINQEIRYKREEPRQKIREMNNVLFSKETTKALLSSNYPTGFHRILCYLLNNEKYTIIVLMLNIYNFFRH